MAEQTGDMICDYCQSTVEKNRFGQREELLICKDCGNKGKIKSDVSFFYCLLPDVVYKKVNKAFNNAIDICVISRSKKKKCVQQFVIIDLLPPSC